MNATTKRSLLLQLLTVKTEEREMLELVLERLEARTVSVPANNN